MWCGSNLECVSLSAVDVADLSFISACSSWCCRKAGRQLCYLRASAVTLRLCSGSFVKAAAVLNWSEIR